MKFMVDKKDRDSSARTGKLALKHGTVKTPVFMPVGTNATVKAMRNDDLEALGINMILSNTYHLYLRPGIDVIKKAGGLHSFMSWKHNILTDSGGFQVFSLTKFRKIESDGVLFRSHIDGSMHKLTPEKVVDIQNILGSDVMMVLDVCTGYDTEKREAEEALEITSTWARRSKLHWDSINKEKGSLWGIVQGNFYEELRKRSAEELISMDFPGYAIGGLSVGEPFQVFTHFLRYTAELLPVEKPRYVMGIGTPEYILEAVESGIDLFDCVFPTRTARNAMAFTYSGTVSLKRESNKYSTKPIDSTCNCTTCRNYSRSYLRHLFNTREILASILTTHHNLYFIMKLVEDIRNSIEEGRFINFKREFLSNYRKENAKDDRNIP